jgi:ABC-2 type transport system permease protein
MNTKHIWTIVDKEWAEVFKNKLVLSTIIFLPMIFTALPLIMLAVSHVPGVENYDTSEVPAMFTQMCTTGTSGNDCLLIYLVSEFLMFYMMMPLIIPIAIASYSVVGEKTTRSLEPLLATPITTSDLMLGKILAAAIPAVGATWLSYILFILLVPVTGAGAAVQSYVTGATWLIAVFLIGPAMSVLAVNFSVIVSSRVSDPRVAEQTSAVLILPLMLLVFGQLAGIIIIGVWTMLIALAVILLLDLGSIYFGTRLFQREVILTRWK